MVTEDFPAERQALSLFLDELRSVAAELLGEASLVHRAICRALRTGDLGQMRHARHLANNLPGEQRAAVARAMAARAGSSAPPRHELLERYCRRSPARFVSFELAPSSGATDDATVSFTHELLPHSAVRVLVSPGTLPQTAADGLRRIASMIERDRRLLSERHWDRQDADAC